MEAQPSHHKQAQTDFEREVVMATARTNSEAVFHLVTVMGIGRALRIEDVQHTGCEHV